MRFTANRHRLGQAVGFMRNTLHSANRAAHTASRLYRATQHIIPDGPIKKQMEKGVSSYEELARRIKDGGE